MPYEKRELIADSAWFLCRTIRPVTGCRPDQVEGYLKSYTVDRIISDAEDIQEHFCSNTANKIQEILVGRLIKDWIVFYRDGSSERRYFSLDWKAEDIKNLLGDVVDDVIEA